MYDGSVGRLPRVARHRSRARGFASKAPIRHLDPVLLLSAFLLTAFGNVMIYSASSRRLELAGGDPRTFIDKQLLFSVLGVVTMIVVASFSYRRFKAWGPLAYIGSVGLLLVVLTPFGSAAKGAQRWIDVGFFQLQPSEFMKLSILVVLALVLSEAKGYPDGRDIARSFMLLAVPVLLIYVQPDLGTLLVLIAIALGVFVVAGTRARILLAILLVGIIAIVGVLQLDLLRDYQRARLTAFLDPSADPQRTGYNLKQARISVGSGGLVGKGLFQGSQTNLSFVPEAHTDFIFTAIAEETGFVGALVLLGLFAIFLWRGLRIAMLSKDLFGTLLAAGIVTMFAFQIFVNIGMTIGVSPITGIPLPFVSYGGSAMVTTYIATGILLNIHMRRVA